MPATRKTSKILPDFCLSMWFPRTSPRPPPFRRYIVAHSQFDASRPQRPPQNICKHNAEQIFHFWHSSFQLMWLTVFYIFWERLFLHYFAWKIGYCGYYYFGKPIWTWVTSQAFPRDLDRRGWCLRHRPMDKRKCVPIVRFQIRIHFSEMFIGG